MFVGAVLFIKIARARGVGRKPSALILLVSTIAGLAGARIGFVIAYGSSAAPSVLSGMSLAAGVATGALVAALLARLLHSHSLRILDAASPAVALGVAVGRVGQLIAGSGLGKPATWALAFVYHGGRLPGFTCFTGQCSAFLTGERQMFVSRRSALLLGSAGERLRAGVGMQPVALLSLVSALALFLVLLVILSALAPRRDGVAFIVFSFWSGASALGLGDLSLDRVWAGMTGTQWIAVAALACAAVLTWWVATHRTYPRLAVFPWDDHPTTWFEPPEMPAETR
jgi:prolipoprotein diacylglyceryltransferase